MSLEDQYEEEDVLQETIAMLNCLEYLRREAISSGLEDAARYIALAADSVQRTISEENDAEPAALGYFAGAAGSKPH